MLVDFEFNMLTSYFQWNLDRWVWKRVASIFKISELTTKKKPSVFPQFWLTKVHCHWWNHPKIMSFAKTPQARDSTNLIFFSRRNKGEPRLKGLDTKRLKAKEMAILRTVMTSHTSVEQFFLGGSTLSCWNQSPNFWWKNYEVSINHMQISVWNFWFKMFTYSFPNVFLGPDLRFGYLPLIEQWRNDATNNGTTQTRP